MMRESLFGTDGIRGPVGEEPITPQTVMKLGWAAGRVLGGDAGVGAKVLIGKDTRVSGYLLEAALEAGFSAAGVRVCFLGPLPTPGIAYLTRTARACAGVAISASHNPYYDNGVKIFSGGGVKLRDALTARIDAMMDKPMKCVDSRQLGKAERMRDAQGRYIEFCKATLPPSRSLAGLKIAVDCANGAAYAVAPHVFAEMGAEVVVIGNQPDGFNINAECGSMHLEALAQTVRDSGADLGVALDGDADRVLLVDSRGERVDGDQILYVLTKHRLRKRRLQKQQLGGVVGTVMSNVGLQLALEKLGVAFVRAQVGDRHVHESLAENGWLLGGETSGHIICLDKSTTGDGIIAALEALDAMLDSGRALHELVDGMTVHPQCIVNVAIGGAHKRRISEDKKLCAAVAQTQNELGKTGRVVLRPSGTEPVIRVMIEGEARARVEQCARELAEAVESAAKRVVRAVS